MAQRLDKNMLGGGEGMDDNASAMEYFLSPFAGGGEGMENYFGSEHIQSLAPNFGGEPGDYGIWTSLPERKKKAA
jgi:hypothetical protein